jgi:hypothetical protein
VIRKAFANRRGKVDIGAVRHCDRLEMPNQMTFDVRQGLFAPRRTAIGGLQGLERLRPPRPRLATRAPCFERDRPIELA